MKKLFTLAIISMIASLMFAQVPVTTMGGVISGNQKTSRLIEFKQKHAIPSHKAEAKSRPIVNAPAYAEGEYMTINAFSCNFNYDVYDEEFCEIYCEMELPYDGYLWIDIHSETPEINATFTKENLMDFWFDYDGNSCGYDDVQDLSVVIAEDGDKIDIYLDTEDGGKYHIVYPFTITDYKTINFTEEQTDVQLMYGYIKITGENENGEYAEFRINTFSTAGSFSRDQISGPSLFTSVDEEVQCFDVKATLDENGVKVVYDGVDGVEYTINFSCTIPARRVARLPFAFDGTRNQLTDGMYQSGLGNDASSSPRLNFDSVWDELVINYDGEATNLNFVLRFNNYRGFFYVQESADGQSWTNARSYNYNSSTYTGYQYGPVMLKPNSRFVRFYMATRISGNVYLGDIRIKTGYKRDVKVGSWGTVCMPFNVDATNILATGAIFYEMTDVDENGTISLYQQNYIQAGYPYIFLAISDKLTLNEADSYVAEEPEQTDYMTGVFEDTQAPVGSYVLQNQKGVYGFYQVAAGEQPTIKANRAYITGQFDARTLLLDDDVTAIKDVKVDGKQTVIYNMAGQRVNKAGKGIFIINGKKVLK